jgi:hypothetical protein
VLGKVLCLHLVLMLLVITVTLYAFLSGMNVKTVNIFKEFHFVGICLVCFVPLFHVCNYGHYFANIVRYQSLYMNIVLHTHTHTHTHTIYIYIYIYMVLFV